MLTIQDLQGSRRRRRRERTMRVVFQAAAIASIVISLLIFFALFRGSINFLRAIDWDFGLLERHRLVPPPDALRPAHDLRRQRGDGQRRDARRGAVRTRHRDLPLRVRPAPGAQGRQADRRDPRRHPLGDRRLLRPQLRRPRRGQPDLQRTGGQQDDARRRSRRRDPRHPDHGGGLGGRPQRGAQLAARGELRLRGPQGQHRRCGSSCPPRSPASSPRSSSPSRGRSARRW